MTVGTERRLAKLEESTLGDLSPEDRVRMALKHAAAGDYRTSRRIGRACPRYTYTMADCEYVDRLDDLEKVAKVAAAMIERYRFTCSLVERFMGFPPGPDGVVDLVLKCMRRRAILEFSADWAGFDAFCRGELGFDARTILQGFTHTYRDHYTEWLDGTLCEVQDLAGYIEEVGLLDELLGLQHDVQEMWTHAWKVRDDPLGEAA